MIRHTTRAALFYFVVRGTGGGSNTLLQHCNTAAQRHSGTRSSPSLAMAPMTRSRKILWASWSLYAVLSVVYTILASFNDKALRNCVVQDYGLPGLGAFLHTLVLNLRVAIIGRRARA